MNKKNILSAILLLLIGIWTGKMIFSNENTSTLVQSPRSNTNNRQHWTCSMHPQIDLPHPGQCPICGMDLIPKENNHEQNNNTVELSQYAMNLADIQTIKINGNFAHNNLTNYLSYPGTIKINTDKSAVQSAHFGGRIEKLFFQSKGDYIAKGSKIALLYSPRLVTAQNELLEALYIKNEQPELYKAVRNKLKNWKLSEKQINKIENSKKPIINFPMYADKNGYILQVLVKSGNHVKEGTPMFQLADLKTVWAVFDVYERDIQLFNIGQHVQIIINAYPDETFSATVDFISPVLNQKTGTIQVRALLSNLKNKLKPGMLLTAQIKVHSNKNNIQIPKSAVLWTGKRSVVYVKVSPDKPLFELREVVLGNETEEFFSILSGLQSGDEIVVNGSFTLDAAAQLQGKKSMMNIKHNNNVLPEISKDILNNSSQRNTNEKNIKMKCNAGKCGSDM